MQPPVIEGCTLFVIGKQTYLILCSSLIINIIIFDMKPRLILWSEQLKNHYCT